MTIHAPQTVSANEGTFNFQYDTEHTRKIKARKGTFIQNTFENQNKKGDYAYQQVTVGQTYPVETKEFGKGASADSTFNVKNTLCRNILNYIFGLDGNNNDLTKADFKKINEKDLQKLDKNIRVKGYNAEQNRVIIDYSYKTSGQADTQNATLIIDIEG